MPENEHDADLALLTEAAFAAGELALHYWKHAPTSWEKEGGQGPVSEADLAVNDLLEARLRAARPGYGWLSEESADDLDRLTRERVFVVDPIDGTRAFLNDEGSFAHALAVVENGRVVAGGASSGDEPDLYRRCGGRGADERSGDPPEPGGADRGEHGVEFAALG